MKSDPTLNGTFEGLYRQNPSPRSISVVSKVTTRAPCFLRIAISLASGWVKCTAQAGPSILLAWAQWPASMLGKALLYPAVARRRGRAEAHQRRQCLKLFLQVPDTVGCQPRKSASGQLGLQVFKHLLHVVIAESTLLRKRWTPRNCSRIGHAQQHDQAPRSRSTRNPKSQFEAVRARETRGLMVEVVKSPTLVNRTGSR